MKKMLTDWKKLGVKLLAIGVGTMALLLGGELVVRHWNPQEIDGWGERIALTPDAQLGWKLKPSQTTQLNWETYRYPMVANSLGFPGPEYPEAKPPNTFRILVTGDAFSTGDGVQPEQNWVRLLEKKLADQGSTRQPDRKVEVLNFSMTGYGPDQYAEVVRTFAPKYKPDLIIVEHYVNDYQDVMMTNTEFQEAIGFGMPDPNGLGTILKLKHLSLFLRNKVYSPIKEDLLGRPSPLYGYELADFDRFKPAAPEAPTRLRKRLQEIQQVAQGLGAKVMLPMVPSAVQVCGPEQLPYYPKHLNLADFDFELPQRNSKAIAQELKLPFIDLIPTLKSSSTCVYQPYNKHWLPTGHEVVAEEMAKRMTEYGF
jgi:lysophospholipase L1-like esterase